MKIAASLVDHHWDHRRLWGASLPALAFRQDRPISGPKRRLELPLMGSLAERPPRLDRLPATPDRRFSSLHKNGSARALHARQENLQPDVLSLRLQPQSRAVRSPLGLVIAIEAATGQGPISDKETIMAIVGNFTPSRTIYSGSINLVEDLERGPRVPLRQAR